MDYTTTESLATLRDLAGPPASHVKFAAAWGEPWIFGIPEASQIEFFARAGFEIVESLRLFGPEATDRYTRRRDGSVVGDLPNGWKGQGARVGYTIAELRLAPLPR